MSNVATHLATTGEPVRLGSRPPGEGGTYALCAQYSDQAMWKDLSTLAFAAGNTTVRRSEAAATTRTLSAKLGEMLSVKDFGAKGDSVTNDTTAIQAAIDAAYLAGGGEVYFPIGRYVVNATINVPQRVTLVGAGLGFANQYSNGGIASPKGSVLYLATGSNCDVVLFRLRLTDVEGTLVETSLGAPNTDMRHFGGMRSLLIWGNRSATATPSSTTDNNTSGNGINVQGSRYIRLEDVVVMFCAQDGITIGSYDYGTGTISSNNMQFVRVSALSNAINGFDLSGGDSFFTDLNSGNNGALGMLWSMSGTVNGGAFWNNGTSGVQTAGTTDNSATVWNGLSAYDNDECGFRIGTGRAPLLNGCIARGNGRDTGAASSDRCNFLISSGAVGWSLTGCRSHATDQDGVNTTQIGFSINNSTYAGSIDGCSDEDSATPFSINNGNNIISHGGGTAVIAHPPIRQTGQIDMNNQVLTNVGMLRYNGWTTITSVTSETISVSGNSLISMNVGAPQNIAAITNGASTGLPMIIIRNISASDLTLVHGASTLRLANATNVVLGTNETIMLINVSGNIWQQIGGAY